MSVVAEAGSAAKPRVRLQELLPLGVGEAVDAGGNGERGVGTAASGIPIQKFELHEDPSFWKDHNVQVIIRLRPLSTSEISLQGHTRCVRQDSSQAITWTGHPESRFTFDLVADEHVSQEKLFKVAGVPMVENCVAGFNSCMFAYGQTGSGKTHTMLGDIEGGTRRHSVNCGMTPRVFEYLFSRMQKDKEARRDEKLQFTCKCSFLEIYNEQILDLLNPSSVNLQIREDARKGVHVENLTEFEVSSARDVMQQLIQGAANRKVASTNMNRASSRSHSVFTCVIESKWESQGIIHHRFARLNLVDLAGSERQKSSGAEGERLKEATNINKSLSTLGLVIMNLVSISNKKSLHVPYRDSKLTFLLQDSLGGNSKTIIIANISPSNCCALETLSTLKFAQRAKFIRNNATINENASGDVLSMRLQIQQLKKELNHLRGLVNGSTENAEGDGSASVSGSPGTFKWEVQGSFSPLTFDQRLTQKKEYDVALVAAIRRDQDKEAALKSLAESKQAAEQLAIQREKEVRSLQMRLRFREERIRRLEAVASEKLSSEAHLQQEKEELLKEIDMIRSQVDRNPEVTRFAMENLQLKEEIRRLQSFVEEGEREMMNEQITILQNKLLEALDWKLMHEKDAKNLSLSWDSSGNEENEFLHLQAIQNQREIEALRKNLTFCLGAKEKLERRVDELMLKLEETKTSTSSQNEERQLLQATAPAVASGQGNLLDEEMDLKAMVDAIALASQKEVEAHETAIALAKENEELHEKLRVLIEDNNKLIELYEHAVAEETTRNVGNATAGVAEDQIDNTFELDRHENPSHEDYYSEAKDIEKIEQQLHEMHEENEKLMGLYERAMQERDECKRMLVTYELDKSKAKETDPIKYVQQDDEQGDQNLTTENPNEHAIHREFPEELLHLVRTKVELVQDKLGIAEESCKYFQLLEKTTLDIYELYDNAKVMDNDIQLKRTQISRLKLALEKMQQRRTFLENKFLALKAALRSFSSKVHYWEERETRATFRIQSCSGLVEQKEQELSYLKNCRDEINAALLKAQDSEVELRKKIDNLKLKLHDSETQRKETEKVLFAIDNIEKSDMSIQKSLIFGKASELLKSEEERTKLSADLKKDREQVALVHKEVSSLKKKSESLNVKIQSLEAEIKSGILSQQEAEVGLQQVMEEKKMLSDMTEVGKTDLETLLVEYQECIFLLHLKAGEIELCEDELGEETRSLEDLKAKINLAMDELRHLMNSKSSPTSSNAAECFSYVSQTVERELNYSQKILVDAKALLVPMTDL